jgi:hypothetical protein
MLEFSPEGLAMRLGLLVSVFLALVAAGCGNSGPNGFQIGS